MQGQWLGEAAALREQWWWSRGVFRQRWWWGSPNTITLRSGSSDGGTEASEGRTMRGKRCSQQWRIQKIFKEGAIDCNVVPLAIPKSENSMDLSHYILRCPYSYFFHLQLVPKMCPLRLTEVPSGQQRAPSAGQTALSGDHGASQAARGSPQTASVPLR